MIPRRLIRHLKAQNWFAVGIDFVIVVIGVGVAMFGQQWLNDRQQRADMAVAEAALQADLFNNYTNAKERLAVANCRAETYQAIAAKLLAAGDNWTGITRAADGNSFRGALPVVFRSPHRNWGSRTWKAELLQTDIFALQGRSKILAVNTTISRSDRLRYYDMLAEMDAKSGLLELRAEQMIQSIEEIGIEIPAEEKPRISEGYARQLEAAKKIYGECYRPQELPVLDAYPKEARTT